MAQKVKMLKQRSIGPFRLRYEMMQRLVPCAHALWFQMYCQRFYAIAPKRQHQPLKSPQSWRTGL